jgi:hypothetical protein
MTLKAVSRHVVAGYALNGPIKERPVSDTQGLWQPLFRDRKTMVLTRHHYGAIGELLHRVIRAVVTEFHFLSISPTR